MTAPVRIQLRRVRGWNLQAVSRATNGLSAVNVARPSRWGNHHRAKDWWQDWLACGLERYWDAQGYGEHWCRERAAQAYDEDVRGGAFLPPDLDKLRGANLACWCPPHTLCHADTLLRLARRRWLPLSRRPLTCEAADV